MEEGIIYSKKEHQNIMEVLNEIKTKLDGTILAPKEEFLDNEQFLFKMGISKRTAQKWRDEGTIAHSQIGKKIYYKSTDVESLLKDYHRNSFNKSYRKLKH